MKISLILKIFSIAVVTAGILWSYKFIPVHLILFILFSIILSFKFELKNRRILNLISILAIIFFFRNLSVSTIITSGINSVCFLIGIKFLERKEYRDYMQIYALVIFLIAGTTLLNFNVKFLIYLSVIVFLCTISTIFLLYFDIDNDLKIDKSVIFSTFSIGSLIISSSIPLMILFFIILPRIDSPIFNFLNRESTGIAGFTDKVTIGDVSKIQKNDIIAFRVKMHRIPDNYLYWRGTSLTYFDGKSWSNPEYNFKKDVIILPNEIFPVKFDQKIFLEPYPYNYLFALDYSKVFIEKKYLPYLKRSISRKIIYYAHRISTGKIKVKIKQVKKYLQIPENINQKIIKLAKKLKSPENIYKFLTSSKFHYTLKNLPISGNPLYDFLFIHRKGNCEYFATAMAILLRINKIPSRIVVGFFGGEYNPVGKYYIIRESNAHTWVEMYKDGAWIRIDPSIRIFPEKISKGSSLFKKLKIYLDLINYYWFIFVVNYSLEDQIRIALKFQNSLTKLNYKILILLCLPVIIALLFYFKNRYSTETVEKKILKKFRKKLRKYGYDFKEADGLKEIIPKIKEEKLKILVENFAELFYECLFKKEKFSKEDIKKIKRILRAI